MEQGGSVAERTRCLPQLPDGWLCNIKWQPNGKFKVWYSTNEGRTFIKSSREMRDYLATRPEMSESDRKTLKRQAKFSQNFAKRMVLLWHAEQREQGTGERDESPAAAPWGDGEPDEAALETILKESGSLNFGLNGRGCATRGDGVASGDAHTGASSSSGGQAEPSREALAARATYDSDLALARRLQAEEDRRAGLRGVFPFPPARGSQYYGEEWGESEEDSYDDYDSEDSEDMIGDVAAGGWRMRESEKQEDVANQEDIECLEVRKFDKREGEDSGHCSVCQEKWSVGDEQRILPCGHGFHPACVDRWLKGHKAQCPLCKKDIREDWEDEEEQVWDPIKGEWVGGEIND